jgi:hypothetical protein
MIFLKPPKLLAPTDLQKMAHQLLPLRETTSAILVPFVNGKTNSSRAVLPAARTGSLLITILFCYNKFFLPSAKIPLRVFIKDCGERVVHSTMPRTKNKAFRYAIFSLRYF